MSNVIAEHKKYVGENNEPEIGYAWALDRLNTLVCAGAKINKEYGLGLTVFEASTILATLFDLPKEKTIEDLLILRSKEASKWNERR